ncbi:hypothetical protein F511_45875 [Dorcoceras hygrometricum]|uniref:Uncharacterized protein n=1 Tax=Dorcoceras hygrometricum TaxID=472368 RepID=A0A2Z7A2H9_9LAMI|nr:hypothetical protein F511_45875 [Dorcoceras hygrometricum]
MVNTGSVVEFEKKPAATNKEFSSWTVSKANPAADDLATQFQQQREIQQRRKLHLLHDQHFSTQSKVVVQKASPWKVEEISHAYKADITL